MPRKKSNLDNACSRKARLQRALRARESEEETAARNAAQRIRTAEIRRQESQEQRDKRLRQNVLRTRTARQQNIARCGKTIKFVYISKRQSKMENDVKENILNDTDIKDITLDLPVVKIENDEEFNLHHEIKLEDEDFVTEYDDSNAIETESDFVTEHDDPNAIKTESDVVKADFEIVSNNQIGNVNYSYEIYSENLSNENQDAPIVNNAILNETHLLIDSLKAKDSIIFNDYSATGENNCVTIIKKDNVETNTIRKEYLPAVVLVEDLGVKLESSNLYCSICKIVFTSETNLNEHKMTVHDFFTKFNDSKDGELCSNDTTKYRKSIRRVKKRKFDYYDVTSQSGFPVKQIKIKDSNDKGKLCSHCNKTYKDWQLVKHLNIILRSSGKDVKNNNKNSALTKVNKLCDEKKSNNDSNINVFDHVINNDDISFNTDKDDGDFVVKDFKVKKQHLSFRITEDMVIKNPPIPTNVLFKCYKCSLHFVTANAAYNHTISTCKNISKDRCTKCMIKFDMYNLEIHELQHYLTESFTVYTFEAELLKKMLCRCPKCDVCFSELHFWEHLNTACDKDFVHCDKCNLKINIESYLDTLHVSCNDHVIVDYFDSVDEVKIKKRIHKQFNLVNNEIYRLWHCEKCRKCGLTNANTHRCNTINSPCNYCGLYFKTISHNSHMQMHWKGILNLNNFLLFSILKQKFIQPPLPMYKFCAKCNMHYLESHRSCHITFKICTICGKKFEEEHYNVHKQFHLYNVDALIQKAIDGNYINKHSPTYIYHCTECKCYISIYDDAVRHAQCHVTKQAKNIHCETCKRDYDNSSYIGHNHNLETFTILKFDYTNLLSHKWFDMFNNIDCVEKGRILKESVFSTTRSLDLSLVQKGDYNKTLYVCSFCSVVVENSELEKHASNKMYCSEKLEYKCDVCEICFSSQLAKDKHLELHASGIKKEDFRIISLNKIKIEIDDDAMKKCNDSPEKCDGNEINIIDEDVGDVETYRKDSEEIDEQIENDSPPGDVTIYKCVRCESCVTKCNIIFHKCTTRRRFCKVCHQWYAISNWESHEAIHKGTYSTVNILIKNFNPNRSVKRSTDEGESKIDERKELVDLKDTQDIQFSNLKDTHKKIRTINKCTNCKLCVVSKGNINKHVCFKHKRSFCYKCKQFYPPKSFISHKLFCNKRNRLRIRNFTPNSKSTEDNNTEIKNEIIYKCLNCNVSLFQTSGLNFHKCVYNEEKIFCKVCKMSFLNQDLEKHDNIHDVYKKIKLINKVFIPKSIKYKESNIKSHAGNRIGTDTGPKKEAALNSNAVIDLIVYKCVDCTVCLFQLKNMNEHFCVPTELKMFCVKCKQSYMYKHLDDHYRIHKLYKQFKLIVKEFKPKAIEMNKNETSLDDKALKIIGVGSIDFNQEKTTKKDLVLYKCGNCNVCLLEIKNIYKHLCISSKFKIFCELCEQTFTSDALKKHDTVHNLYRELNFIVKTFTPKNYVEMKNIKASSNENTFTAPTNYKSTLIHATKKDLDSKIAVNNSKVHSPKSEKCEQPSTSNKSEGNDTKVKVRRKFILMVKKFGQKIRKIITTKKTKRLLIENELKITDKPSIEDTESVKNSEIFENESKVEIKSKDIYEKYEVYGCSHCNIHYLTEEDRREHYTNKHQIKDSQNCIYCNIKFPSNSLNKHHNNCPRKTKRGYIRIIYGDSETILDPAAAEVGNSNNKPMDNLIKDKSLASITKIDAGDNIDDSNIVQNIALFEVGKEYISSNDDDLKETDEANENVLIMNSDHSYFDIDLTEKSVLDHSNIKESDIDSKFNEIDENLNYDSELSNIPVDMNANLSNNESTNVINADEAADADFYASEIVIDVNDTEHSIDVTNYSKYYANVLFDHTYCGMSTH